MIITLLLFILGLAVIIKGGDLFVDASVWIAKKTGMPRMLIGATVVSLATTLPEFFVSVIAVSKGVADLGIGNAIGSVICNTGLILALSLIIRPQRVKMGTFFAKAAVMVVSLLLLFVLCLDSSLSAAESIPLYLLLSLFVYSNVREARNGDIRTPETAEGRPAVNIVKFIAGAAGIVIGARILVDSAVKIAASLGISDGIIGVTIVALGTSLPELVTTITALKKKESEIGIGNIIGANIINITLVLSTCALLGGNINLESSYLPTLSGIMPRSLYIDIPVAALLFVLLLVPPLFFKGRLARFQGVLMIGVYFAFIVFLIINL